MSKFDQLFESILQGLAKGMSVDDIAKKHKVSVKQIQNQLKKGIEVEFEHTKDEKVAEQIAKDHLFETPDFYSKLAKVEKP